MSISKNFSDRDFESGILFQTFRKRARLRQQDIAKLVGVGSNTVEYWESGTTYPKVETLKKLLEIYLRYQLFTSGEELAEAEEIWERVRQEAPRFNALFDRKWFENLVISFNHTLSETKLNSTPPGESTTHSNLPQRLTSFVGRKKELTTLTTWLQPGIDPLPGRLLTLTGAGGCGKTSLALEVVRQVAGQYRHTAWLVELAAISTPASLIQAMAASLGLKEQPGTLLLATITNFLREKQLLLVLDNCEHLVKECAGLVNSLLRECPGLTVVATSRESLQVSGENVFRVPSLSLPPLPLSLSLNSIYNRTPGPDSNLNLPGSLTSLPLPIEELLEYEAIQLFLTRARSVNPGFTLDEQNKTVVAQLCHRLDGIPLAIELAAARLRVLDIFQLSERLSDRFRLLKSGADRTVLPRHQTLRATVEWSYDLLGEPERQLFRQLSVFAGGWHLEAAENICFLNGPHQEEVLDLLNELVNKSLVIVEEAIAPSQLQGKPSILPSQPKLRFRLLETLREFGREQLEKASNVTARQGDSAQESEQQAVNTRHLLYFASFAGRCLPEDGPVATYDMGRGLDLLNGEYANLRSALNWSCAPENQTVPARLLPVGLELACSVARLWDKLNYFEEASDYLGRLIDKALQAGLGKTSEYAWTCYWLGRFTLSRGEFNHAYTIHLETLELFKALKDRRGILVSVYYLGICVKHQGEIRKAIELHQQSLALATELPDKRYKAKNSSQLGYIYNELGEYSEAEAHIKTALKEAREIGDPGEIAECLIRFSPGLIFQGKYETANTYLQESIPLLQETGNKSNLSKSLGNLGYLAYVQGDKEKAVYYFKEALYIQKEVGARDFMAVSLSNLAGLLVETGNFEEADRFNKEALVLYQELGDKLGVALCTNTSSQLDLNLKDYSAAIEKLKKALVIFKDLEEKSHVIECLLGLADITLIIFNEPPREDPESVFNKDREKDEQYLERAARLAGIIAAISINMRLKLPTSYQEIFDRVSEKTRSKMVGNEYDQLFAEGRGLPFEEALAYAING